MANVLLYPDKVFWCGNQYPFKPTILHYSVIRIPFARELTDQINNNNTNNNNSNNNEINQSKRVINKIKAFNCIMIVSYTLGG